MSKIDWQAEILRVTVSGPLLTPRPLYEDIVGAIPEQLNSKPHQGTLEEFGPYQERRLVLFQAPARLDLLWSDFPDANLSDATQANFRPFYSIGPLDNKIAQITEFGQTIIKKIEGFSQVGLGAVLIRPTQSEEEAVTVLSHAISDLHIKPEIDREIVWQLKRTWPSSSAPFGITALCKWHTLTVRAMGLIGPPSNFANLPSPSERFCARLEIDLVSGFEDAQSMERSQADALLAELASVATSIAAVGFKQ